MTNKDELLLLKVLIAGKLALKAVGNFEYLVTELSKSNSVGDYSIELRQILESEEGIVSSVNMLTDKFKSAQ